MSFEIKIPDNLKNIAAVYDKKLKEGTAKAFAAALEEEAREIITRTKQGLDVKGSPFEGYAAATRRQKIALGRPQGRVDLTNKNNMLRGLRSKIKRAVGYLEGTIFLIPSQRDKARWNQFGGRVGKKNPAIRPAREFFGLSKEQIIRITQKIRNALTK